MHYHRRNTLTRAVDFIHGLSRFKASIRVFSSSKAQKRLLLKVFKKNIFFRNDNGVIFIYAIYKLHSKEVAIMKSPASSNFFKSSAQQSITILLPLIQLNILINCRRNGCADNGEINLKASSATCIIRCFGFKLPLMPIFFRA